MSERFPPVLILHNVPRAPSDGRRAWAESDAGVLTQVRAVEEALARLGIEHRIAGAANFEDLPAVLSAATEPLVFNLVEGFHADPHESNFVPVIARAYGKSCTGSDTGALLLALDKWQSKCVLCAAGVKCPRGTIVPVGEKARKSALPPGPYFVKPVRADASEGIDASSVVARAGKDLDRAVARVHDEFYQPALVEEFIGKREINVSLLERGGRVEVLPLAEIDFSSFGEDRPRIVDYSAKWLPETVEYQGTNRIISAELSKSAAERVRRYALASWRAIGCRDYARVDLRLTEKSEPYVIEVNPNPDITPEAGFSAVIAAAGMSYDEFVMAILDNALGRLEGRSAGGGPREGRAAAKGKAPYVIRASAAADRGAILSFLTETAFFRPDEISVAREVLDDALELGPASGYQSFTLEADGEPAGWICFGATPCTVGTYDVYWIAVSPRHQARGLGSALINHAESLIRKRGGRISVIETSGREVYEATRQFYLKRGYTESARLKDFYAPGDDKVVYTKTLA